MAKRKVSEGGELPMMEKMHGRILMATVNPKLPVNKGRNRREGAVIFSVEKYGVRDLK